jgi:hypothetical protein
VISSVNNANSAVPAISTYGSGAIDSYGPLIIQDNSGDSYSGTGSAVVVQESSPVITQASEPAPAPASDSYGGAIAPVIVQTEPQISVVLPQASNPAPASDSYGGALSPVISEVSNPAPAEAAPDSDSYGGAVAPVIHSNKIVDAPSDPQIAAVLPQADQDSYGTPQSNVVAPQADSDDYDPNDVPADQAAPLPGYASSDTLDSDEDDYDPNDIPADQAADTLPAGNSDTIDSYGKAQSPILDPIISDNSVDTGSQQTFDVYGSALAPVGTSAPGMFP